MNFSNLHKFSLVSFLCLTRNKMWNTCLKKLKNQEKNQVSYSYSQCEESLSWLPRCPPPLKQVSVTTSGTQVFIFFPHSAHDTNYTPFSDQYPPATQMNYNQTCPTRSMKWHKSKRKVDKISERLRSNPRWRMAELSRRCDPLRQLAGRTLALNISSRH